MNDVTTLLVATEAKDAAQSQTTLEGRIRAAMKSAANHWMVLDRDQQMRGAIAAIYELSDAPTRKRIERELDVMRALTAASQGVPVDFAAVLNESDDEPEPIGLAKYWREAVGA